MGKPREEDSCSTIRACYSVYPVAEAAALCCGVAPEDVKQELRARLCQSARQKRSPAPY